MIPTIFDFDLIFSSNLKVSRFILFLTLCTIEKMKTLKGSFSIVLSSITLLSLMLAIEIPSSLKGNMHDVLFIWIQYTSMAAKTVLKLGSFCYFQGHEPWPLSED